MTSEPSLTELQRAFTRVCFDVEPRPSDLAVLTSDPQRWLMYRRMVRSRLFDMARSGLPRTAALLGKARFDAAVGAYLAERAPHSRFIREVVHELVDHALPGWAADPSLPAHCADLVRYEDTKWAVASAEWEAREAVDFDFEAVPVLNPTIRTLTVAHRVDKIGDAGEAPAALDEDHLVIVYRKPESPRIFSYVLNAIGGRLFTAWQVERSCADGVRAVMAELDRGPDPRFVDGMAGVLADLVEQQIILGSRPS
jgi:hypothetical protein